ncbi:ECF transporter S component [Lacrimispora sp. JR3]|uniref:ECF transporter S component n=1 Tax=Lacrimispora sinapis TaxID=3111456 RepID=UPI00374A6ED9
MNRNQTKKIVFTALMASLTAAATMVIHIPSPLHGYIHLGDGMVLLSSFILGPFAGAAAGGIGSMLADLLSGYAFYAPATLLIKSLGAFLAGILYRRASSKNQGAGFKLLPVLSAGTVCSIVVTGGYFLFESTVYGPSASVVNVPLNVIQNLSSLIVACSLMPVLLRIDELRGFK